jgi:hypothetical protein
MGITKTFGSSEFIPKKQRHKRSNRVPRTISRYTGLPLLMDAYHSIDNDDEDLEKNLNDEPDGPDAPDAV